MPVVSMYFLDNKQQHTPHIHVEYQGREAVVAIPSGEVIEGEIPSGKLKLLAAWVEIHQEELMADWALAVKGQSIFKIEPLH